MSGYPDLQPQGNDNRNNYSSNNNQQPPGYYPNGNYGASYPQNASQPPPTNVGMPGSTGPAYEDMVKPQGGRPSYASTAGETPPSYGQQQVVQGQAYPGTVYQQYEPNAPQPQHNSILGFGGLGSGGAQMQDPGDTPGAVMCAQAGCVLSLCCPIAGLLTFCFHLGAPKNSTRKKWATAALLTAVVLITIGLIVSLTTSSARGHLRGR